MFYLFFFAVSFCRKVINDFWELWFAAFWGRKSNRYIPCLMSGTLWWSHIIFILTTLFRVVLLTAPKVWKFCCHLCGKYKKTRLGSRNNHNNSWENYIVIVLLTAIFNFTTHPLAKVSLAFYHWHDLQSTCGLELDFRQGRTQGEGAGGPGPPLET